MQCPLRGAWGRWAKSTFQQEHSQGVCGGFRLVVSTDRNLGDDMWEHTDSHISGYCLRGSF